MVDAAEAIRRIGARVQGIRAQRGLSKRQLSISLQLHRTAIADLEAADGRHQLYLDTLVRVAHGLGVAPSEVFRGVLGRRSRSTTAPFRLDERVGRPFDHDAFAATFRERLRAARRSRGIGQKTAEATVPLAGVCQEWISRVESGFTTRLNLLILITYCEQLGIDLVSEVIIPAEQAAFGAQREQQHRDGAGPHRPDLDLEAVPGGVPTG